MDKTNSKISNAVGGNNTKRFRVVKTLLVGYKAADLSKELLEGDVTCHTLDIYHRHAIEKVWHAKTVCTPHLPEGPWDRIFFKTGPKLMAGELSLDLLQEIAALVGSDLPASRFRLDFVGRERDRNDLLEKVKGDPGRVRSFKAEWPASVPGGQKLMFTSYPGCFCHRRLDEGGLALAEVVTRDLLSQRSTLNSQPSTLNPQPVSLLDMGCGCGLVGLLIAHRLRYPAQPSTLNPHPSSLIPHPSSLNPHPSSLNPQPAPVRLTLIDSHARAVEAATENAAKFEVPAEVILADNGSPARTDGTYDVFVGNPPYYSDYRIADVFLATAKRALKPGGVCYTVCKNAAGLEPVQRRFFPDVEIIRRRGYAVLKSRQLFNLSVGPDYREAPDSKNNT